MKIIFPIGIFIMAFFSGCNTPKKPMSTPLKGIKPFASYNNDTLAYVKENFINRKQYYIGHSLIKLLKDIELPVQSYLIGYLPSKINLVPDISLSFYTIDEGRSRAIDNLQPLLLHIEWQQPLSKNIASKLARENRSAWTKNEREYYGKQIIKDIFLTDFSLLR